MIDLVSNPCILNVNGDHLYIYLTDYNGTKRFNCNEIILSSFVKFLKRNNEKYVLWRDDKVNEYYFEKEKQDVIYSIRVYADHYDPSLNGVRGYMPDMTVSKNIYCNYRCVKKNGRVVKDILYEYKLKMLNDIAEFSV